MTFLQITDPKRRDGFVKEFLNTKKTIQARNLMQRVGDLEFKRSGEKLFRPIVESQKTATETITKSIEKELEPIKFGIAAVTKNAIETPTPLAIEEPKKEIEESKTMTLGPTASKYLKLHTNQGATKVDKVFGIYGEDGKFKIGDSEVKFIGGDDLEIKGNRFKGTRGLWELLVKKEPQNYDDADYDAYREILQRTNAMYRNNNPNSAHPKSSRSPKWVKIVSKIWDEQKTSSQKGTAYKGNGVSFLPSDPNALVERLQLIIAGYKAGHTELRNQIVDILDELKRRGDVSPKDYKEIHKNTFKN